MKISMTNDGSHSKKSLSKGFFYISKIKMKVELKEFLLKNPYEKNFPIVRKE